MGILRNPEILRARDAVCFYSRESLPGSELAGVP